MSLQDPIASEAATGADVYAAARNHPGVAALHRYVERLGAEELPREKIRSFFADMTAFNRYITPGIPALASRLADELFEYQPYRAHGIAAHILDASIDEYGLSGTKPHNVLLLDFAKYFGLTEEEVNAPENAVPFAREMGEKMYRWYREAPVDFALGVHTASEVTGYEEAHGFYRAFLTPPKYGLTAQTPAFIYVATHVENEEDHSKDTVICLDEYLKIRPESEAAVFEGCRAYMEVYERMFDQMLSAIA